MTRPVTDPPAAVGRRTLLTGTAGAAALLALTGCDGLRRTTTSTERAEHPDAPALAAALDDQQRLLAAALAVAPALPAPLADGLVERARARLDVLTTANEAPGETTPSPSGGPATVPPAPPTPASDSDDGQASSDPTASGDAPVPSTPVAFARATVRAARARTRGAGDADDGGVARLLAALAAGYGQDVDLLAAAGVTR